MCIFLFLFIHIHTHTQSLMSLILDVGFLLFTFYFLFFLIKELHHGYGMIVYYLQIHIHVHIHIYIYIQIHTTLPMPVITFFSLSIPTLSHFVHTILCFLLAGFVGSDLCLVVYLRWFQKKPFQEAMLLNTHTCASFDFPRSYGRQVWKKVLFGPKTIEYLIL